MQLKNDQHLVEYCLLNTVHLYPIQHISLILLVLTGSCRRLSGGVKTNIAAKSNWNGNVIKALEH